MKGTDKMLLHTALFTVLLGVYPAWGAQQAKTEAPRASVEAEKQAAIQEVQKIVNQPVKQIPRTEEMDVSTYRPGWFLDGAKTPDFNNVDVRRTQDTSYGKHQYVTSDLNAGVVFLGQEVEFNPMTKYFYTDRSLPKKRLSEQEMLEINRLYRIIGGCEQRLVELQK
jgi:hypothetical protein